MPVASQILAGLGALTLDSSGNVLVNLATNISGEDDAKGVLKIVDGCSHYEAVTTLNVDVTLGVTGGSGDYLGRLTISIATQPADVILKDGTTTILTLKALAVGNYSFPIGLPSVNGAWKVNIANGSATNSNILAHGLFT